MSGRLLLLGGPSDPQSSAQASFTFLTFLIFYRSCAKCMQKMHEMANELSLPQAVPGMFRVVQQALLAHYEVPGTAVVHWVEHTYHACQLRLTWSAHRYLLSTCAYTCIMCACLSLPCVRIIVPSVVASVWNNLAVNAWDLLGHTTHPALCLDDES